MDAIANKVKTASQALIAGQTGAGGNSTSVLGNFSATFTEFLSKATSGVMNGQSGKSDQRLSGAVASKSERAEPAPEPQAKAPVNEGDRHERAALSDKGDDTPRENAAPVRDDDRAPVASKDSDSAPEAPVAKTDSHGDERPTETADSDAKPVEAAASSENDSTETGTGEQAAADTDTSAPASETATTETVATTGTAHAAEVLAGLLDTAEGATNGIAAGQAANTASNTPAAQATAGETGRANAAQGLTNAINNVTKGQTAAATAATGDDGVEVQAQTTQTQNTTANAARTAANANPVQTAAQQNQAATTAPVVAEVAKQADDLGRRIGPDQRMTVQVNVTKEGETLVSQPTQSRVAVDLGTDATNAKPLTPTQATTNTTQNQTPQAVAATVAPEVQAQAQNQAQTRQGELLAQARAATALAQATLSNQGRASSTIAANAPVAGDPAVHSVNAPTPSQTAAATQAAEKAAKPQFTPSRENVTNQVNVQITKAVAAGADKIHIQLRPAHMGRVDVQLEMSSDGRVTAAITADNKDTLDMLQRDSRTLEKALQDAGLQANAGSMSFNLRGENAPDQGNGSSQNGRAFAETDETPDVTVPTAAYEGGIMADGRIDIRA